MFELISGFRWDARTGNKNKQVLKERFDTLRYNEGNAVVAVCWISPEINSARYWISCKNTEVAQFLLVDLRALNTLKNEAQIQTLSHYQHHCFWDCLNRLQWLLGLSSLVFFQKQFWELELEENKQQYFRWREQPAVKMQRGLLPFCKKHILF